MPPTGQAYNTDWIFSNNSNVHVANHRDWFTSYTPFEATTEASDLKAEGAGTVELPVETAKGPSTLVLHGVIYAPKCLTNILGGPILKDHTVSLGDAGELLKRLPQGGYQCAALIDCVKLFKLRLQGQSPTQTCLNRNGHYMLRVSLGDEDIIRLDRALCDAGLEGRSGSRNVKAVDLDQEKDEPTITAEERSYIEEHCGGQFYF